MLKNWCIRRLVSAWLLTTIAIFCGWSPATGQNGTGPTESPDANTLRLRVDEVVLTFNAMNAQGLPIHDLKTGDIRVRDNGLAPRRIVAFDELVNRPLRAGVLLDISESMSASLAGNKTTAEKFVRRLFRQNSDQAFVSTFGFASEQVQSWTGDAAALSNAIEGARGKSEATAGTALFNAVFRACSYSFDQADPTATGNFILLFSDGEDNAGLTSLAETARACQRSNIQVFAFVPSAAQDRASTGPRALRELAAKTGGRVFLADDSDQMIWNDLQAIESEMRNQYRLVYHPAEFKHDGAFHEIELQPPDRVTQIEIRRGYFAPSH